jgi:hypothetical protein
MVDYEINIPVKTTSSGTNDKKDIGKSIAEQIKKSLDSIGITKTQNQGGVEIIKSKETINKASGIKEDKQSDNSKKQRLWAKFRKTCGSSWCWFNGSKSALSVVLEGLMQTLEPLINVLKALFVVVFLPLMPIIKDLTKVIGQLIPGIQKLFGGEINLGDFVKTYMGPFLEGVGKAFWDFLKLIAAAGFEIGKWIGGLVVQLGHLIGGVIVKINDYIIRAIFSAIKFFRDIINGIYESLGNMGMKIWNFIWDGLQFIGDIGEKIWNFILEGLRTMGDLGSKIWDFIKGAISSLGGIFSGGNSGSSNEKRAVGGPVTGGTTYMVGEKGPELFTPSSSGSITSNNRIGGESITINVTGNNFRDEQDMKKLADIISQRLQRSSRRSFS